MDRSDEDKQLLNITNTLNLIHILKKHSIKRFISAGTLAEYDILNAYNADGIKLSPNSRYAASKLATHLFSKILCNQLDIQHIWCTIANVYGVGDMTSNIVNYTIDIFSNNRDAEFTEGKQLYDLINIRDLTVALMTIVEKGKPDVEYYIGSGDPKPLKEYITAIRDAINPRSEIYFGRIPYNGVSLPIGRFSIEKISKLGFKPTVDFKNGLSELLLWKNITGGK